MRTLLIDADVLAFQHSTAAEVAIEWEPDFWTLHADAGAVKESVAAHIDRLLADLDAERVVLAFSDTANFRKGVLPSYKANRKATRKPVCYKAVKEWMAETYETFIRPGLEGDDVLGILATRTNRTGEEFVVVSIDKDFKTIPGRHFNMGKPELGVFEVSVEEADRWHLMQTLMGDATDGYAGCPGIGPKTAEKILDKDCSWAAVVAAYEKAGLSEEEALVQARCARILRASDYDFKTKTVKLWTP